jgi:uncharacterized protein YneF (UPF0154 family)
VTREVRFAVITTAIVAAAIAGFYFLSRHIGYQLAERPYIANIKQQLRALAAGQAAYLGEHRGYASDVIRVWVPPNDNTAHGVRLRIVAADSNGYLAEGRSDGWDGRCVLAVGSSAGDSLPPGEPVCSRD